MLSVRGRQVGLEEHPLEKQMSEITNDEQLQTAVKDLLREVRHERDRWGEALATLRGFLEGDLKSAARHIIEEQGRKEPLELQWQIEELLADTSDAPPAPETPEPEVDDEVPEASEAPNDPETAVVAPVRPEDLVAIYEDPRGIMIHRHAIDGRWFLTQVHPMTGQPQTVELAAQDRGDVQQQLAGSPYWIEKQWDVNPGSPLG